MNNNELPQEGKELIAKIDERLKKLEMLLDEALSKETPETLTEWIINKRKCGQADKEEYVKCIDNSDCENVLIKGKVYKVNLEDETWIYVTDEEEDNENYSKKRFKPSTKEAYLKQFSPDNEQQAPVEWKVSEWAWSGKSKTMLSLITAFEDKLALVNNQNGLIECWDIDLMVKPTKEEIEQHLVKIAEKKYKVGDILDNGISKLKITSLEYHYTNGNLYAQSCCINTGIIGGDERITDTEIWSHKHGWADFKSETTPKVTEQKERFEVDILEFESIPGDHKITITTKVGTILSKFEAERAAQAIRETLSKL